MELYNNIKKYRKELHMTQQQLADLTGYGDRSSIAKIEKGLVDISQSKLELFAKVLGVTPGELMGDTTPTPVYSAAAGEGLVSDGTPDEYINTSPLEADQAIARVVGQSMEPTLLDGDLVIVQAQNVIDYPRQICLVQINGDEPTLKRVEIQDEGITLIGDNVSVYTPHFFSANQVRDLPVKIHGVVVKMIREFD